MKKILYTQRVDVIESYGERRDATDIEIPKLLYECGFLPVPAPNDAKIAANLLEEILPNGILFTGGNSLIKYGGDAPERDETEKLLLDTAINENLPVLGICRGYQFIADYFGGELKKIQGHVRTTHKITGEIVRENANSFHDYAIKKLPPSLMPIGICENDNTVEAIRHKNFPITGIMWHPERGKRQQADIELIRKVF